MSEAGEGLKGLGSLALSPAKLAQPGSPSFLSLFGSVADRFAGVFIVGLLLISLALRQVQPT